MVLVSSAYVNDNEPLAVFMMDYIILLILLFSSCSILYMRDATSLTNCSAFNFVFFEFSSCSCDMINFLITPFLLLLMYG